MSVRTEGQASTRGQSHGASRRMRSSSWGAKSGGARTNTEFLRMVERTEDAFALADDSAVEDVRRILSDVRRQYDEVHNDAEKRDQELQRLKEAIRVAEQAHSLRAEEAGRHDESRSALVKLYEETLEEIHEAQTSQKVYKHMLARITKEQAILKQKMLLMEAHLGRKNIESHRKVASQERLVRKGAVSAQELEILEQDVRLEQVARENAQKHMMNALQSKMDAQDRRGNFELWRHEVAQDAANEAFNASAGRLRKLYAVEKLTGNLLQKTSIEQLMQSQLTEEGFQRIREVTGLGDVMDIVHKFLNRDVEQEQLKSSVKEAEARLDQLREQYESFKRDTDGLTFDTELTGRSRTIYLEFEENEAALSQAIKAHEQSRAKLQQSTLQIEHMKRWANRMAGSLKMFEDCVRVDKPADLPIYFQQMQRAVDKFIAHIVQQISAGKVQRKNMSQVASKEFHEASRLLADKEFVKINCRVPASLDAGRPSSRQGNVEDDSAEAHLLERERCKLEAKEKESEGKRKAFNRASEIMVR